MLSHLNLDTIIGIAVGIVGGFSYFRMANLNVLKVEIESLRRQVGDLDLRCKTLEVERDSARREIVGHYTARTEIAAENRELHKLVEERDETIIKLQSQIIEAQQNTLRTLAT